MQVFEWQPDDLVHVADEAECALAQENARDYPVAFHQRLLPAESGGRGDQQAMLVEITDQPHDLPVLRHACRQLHLQSIAGFEPHILELIDGRLVCNGFSGSWAWFGHGRRGVVGRRTCAHLHAIPLTVAGG